MLIEGVQLQIRDTCHTTLCERRVRLVQRCLADHTHFAFVGTGYLQGVAHSCHTSTYNQKIVFVNHCRSKLCCKVTK